MKKSLASILLTITILIAVVTRLYKLGEEPNGLYLDEVSQGYSAYSIFLTGKDEFGKAFPIIFRSFTDFKTPVYTYFIVPLIPVFGLTAFAVRFPSFFFSILTIPITYLLIKRISPKNYSPVFPTLVSLLLAISPWHILFGRAAFECNIALFFFLTGIYFFYRGLIKPKNLILCGVFLAISLIAYHAQRLLIPAMGLFFFVRHKKTLLKKSHIYYLIAGIFIAFLIILPTISIINSPGLLTRAAGLNIFSPDKFASSGKIEGLPELINPIVNNKIYLAAKEFSSLYISYLSPRYLFSIGDFDPRTSYPELATFFVWQFPFYIFGLYETLKNKNLKELRFFTLTFLFLSPLPAAITRDPYSSIRSFQMVIPLTVIITLGLYESRKFLSGKLIKNIALTIITLTIIYSLGKIYSSAIILNRYYRAREWDFGWVKVAQSIEKLDPNLPIVVDTGRHGPYIELAFFLKYDPEKFQKENFEVTSQEYYKNLNRRSSWNLGNITVKSINWKLDTTKKQYLIGDRLAISDEQIKEHNFTLIEEILYPDGIVAFKIIETNPK